jgi:hypothetical protein
MGANKMNNDKELLIQFHQILECYDFYDKEVKTHEQVDEILDVVYNTNSYETSLDNLFKDGSKQNEY